MDSATKWLVGVGAVAALGGVGALVWRKRQAAANAVPGKPTGERIPGKTQPMGASRPTQSSAEVKAALERGKGGGGDPGFFAGLPLL